MDSVDKYEAPKVTSFSETYLTHGGVSQVYLLEGENGKKLVHKVMNSKKLRRYGLNATNHEITEALIRIHGLLSRLFEGHVADTKFYIGKDTSGQESIEVLQEFVDGSLVDPASSDTSSLHKWVLETAGGLYELKNKIRDEAGVSKSVAHGVANEILKPENWMRQSNGNATLIDF